jgi:type IV secretory pathway VirB10-like protein
MFVYPKNSQTQDLQIRDEYDCYGSVQQQTGINPEAPPPAGATAADVQAAEEQAAANAPQAKGGRSEAAKVPWAGRSLVGSRRCGQGRGLDASRHGAGDIAACGHERPQQASQAAGAMQQQSNEACRQPADEQVQAGFLVVWMRADIQ